MARAPGKPRDAIAFEGPKDTAARHAANYITERERRFLAMIDAREPALVTPAQAAYAATIRAALIRRGDR